MTTGSILVTGATGFIGRHVCRYFAAQGWSVIGLGTDAPENAPLADLAGYYALRLPAPELEAILQRHQPDLCIHCAGRASVGWSVKDPVEDFHSGPWATFSLLNAIRQHAPGCGFIFISSAAVYGNPHTLPVNEAQTPSPISPYGYHKWQCELLCQEFQQVYGIPTVSVRIFSAYGPGLRRQVIWDICHQALSRQRLDLFGTGEESRDFIHVSDIAQALYLVGQKAPMTGEVYNLASGQDVTIRALADMIVAAAGTQMPIHFDGQVPAGTPLNWRADIRKITRLGFSPAMPLAQGIPTFTAWCRAELLGM
jgi:UDP-glucose 4-epimerase